MTERTDTPLRYAVNLADLMRMPPLAATFLIGPVRGEVSNIDKRKVDATIVELDCDAERAEAIVAVIRVRYNRNELRCYKRGRRGGWKRI